MIFLHHSVFNSIVLFHLSSIQTHAAKILRATEDLYAWLPLATIIDNKVFVVHGGVSDTTNLKDVAAIDRHKVRKIFKSSTALITQLERRINSKERISISRNLTLSNIS